LTISLVLVTDGGVYAMGFEALVADDREAQLIAVATSPDDCLQLLMSTVPDLVAVDYDMDDAVGLCEQLSARWPALPVLVLATVLSDVAVHAALYAGVVGFVSKRNDCEYLRNAVKRVADGQSVLDPRVTRSVIAWATGGHAGPGQIGEWLSGRELQVLRLVARGESNKRVATRMGLSESTVKTYLGRIYRKINCGTRSEAAVWLTRQGAF
jgi:DNA-binding NarL/FixJ family response regulator